jgi:hypothetical protein
MARTGVRVVIDEAAVNRMVEGSEVKGLLNSAAQAALAVARSGAPDEEGFSSSFSIREGVKGRGQGSYVYVRVWNSSPIANLIEFGAPKRRGPRRNGRYLGRGFDSAVGRLTGGG